MMVLIRSDKGAKDCEEECHNRRYRHITSRPVHHAVNTGSGSISTLLLLSQHGYGVMVNPRNSVSSQLLTQSIFRICRGHEKRRLSRLPPSPNTYCPDKHLHLTISSPSLTISTLTVASSQEPSWRKVSHENMCPIVRSRAVSKPVRPPPNTFLRSRD